MTWEGTWFGHISGGASVGSGQIVTLTPAPGQISTDPDVARWTPIVALVELRDNDSFFAYYITDKISTTVYDPDTAFSIFYADKSSVVVATPNPDTGAARLLVTILPNGGWQNDEFKIILSSGIEMSIA